MEHKNIVSIWNGRWGNWSSKAPAWVQGKLISVWYMRIPCIVGSAGYFSPLEGRELRLRLKEIHLGPREGLILNMLPLCPPAQIPPILPDLGRDSRRMIKNYSLSLLSHISSPCIWCWVAGRVKKQKSDNDQSPVSPYGRTS